MANFIQIISRDGNQLSINLVNVVKVRKSNDGTMFISFSDGKGLHTKTTYDEFLKLSGQDNSSVYNDPKNIFTL